MSESRNQAPSGGPEAEPGANDNALPDEEEDLQNILEKANPRAPTPPKSFVNADGTMKTIKPPANVNMNQFYPTVDSAEENRKSEIVYGEVLEPPPIKPQVESSDTSKEDGNVSETLQEGSEADPEKSIIPSEHPDGSLASHSQSHISPRAATDATSPSEQSEEKDDSGDVFSTQVDEETIEAARRRNFNPQNNIFEPEGWAPSREGTSLQQVVYERAGEHYDSSMDHVDASDHEGAILSLTKAINLKPKDVEYYVQRGECFLHLCDFQSAILNFKRACVLEPNNVAFFNRLAFVYFFQGQCLFDQKLFPEALESFSRAAEMRPEVIGYHTRSIACLAALERHGECLALVNKRLEQEQDNADLYIMRARLHKLFRNTTLCYYDVKDALAIDPDHEEAQNLMKNLEDRSFDLKKQAMTLNLLSRHRDALQKISIAIETNPSVAEFHNIRGALHRRLGDFNAAIDDYLLALDKTDHDEESPVYKEAQRQLLLTYNDFAVECFTKGFYEEAIILLNKAIKGEKSEKGLYVNRGDCFFREGNLQFAMADYQQAMELDPRDNSIRARVAVIHNEHGVSEYNDKNYQEAESRLTLAIQHNPKMGQYYVSRARVRQVMENMSGARQDVLMALLLDPTNDEMMAILSRMFPGKTVKDVLHSRAAHHAKEALTNLVVTASPVRLDPLMAYPDDDQATGAVEEEPEEEKMPPLATSCKPGECFPSLKACMKEKEFNIKIARDKARVNKSVKNALHNRRTLKYGGGRVSNMPDAVPYTKVESASPLGRKALAVHAPVNDKPAGWKKFGKGISVTSTGS